MTSLFRICARHERWAFQFTVAPLRVDKATGSPANPIAIFWRPPGHRHS